MGVFPDAPLAVPGNHDHKAEAQGCNLSSETESSLLPGEARGACPDHRPSGPLWLGSGRMDGMNLEVPAGLREGWPAGVGRSDPASSLQHQLELDETLILILPEMTLWSKPAVWKGPLGLQLRVTRLTLCRGVPRPPRCKE